MILKPDSIKHWTGQKDFLVQQLIEDITKTWEEMRWIAVVA
jgi:hypothetical protein